MAANAPPAPNPARLKAHAQAVIDDLPALIKSVALELSRLQPAGLLGGRHLSRGDQVAVQTVLGTLQQPGEWAPRLEAALGQAVRSALAPPAEKRPSAPAGGTGSAAGAASFAMASGIEALSLSFSLKDEKEVEWDIELSRLIQQLESKAEAALRELRPLSAALRGQAVVTDDAPLLHPQACATALTSSIQGLPLSGDARVCCLHALSLALTDPMCGLYQSQVGRLREMGVEPAKFRVLPSVAQPVRRAAGYGDASTGSLAAGASPGAHAVLSRLVSQARAQGIVDEGHWDGSPGSDAARGEHHDAALAVGNDVPDRGSAEALMRQLLSSVGDDVRAGGDMRQVFARLAEPGLRLAERDPALWNQHDHPWWLMLDRLLALCSVLDDAADPARPEQGPVQADLATQCEAVLTQFETSTAPHTGLCLQLLTQLDGFGAAHRSPQAQEGSAQNKADDGDEADKAQPASDMAALLREQMAAQLRQSQAPASVRRFLLGPWIDVLAHAMAHDAEPARAQRYSDVVDHLLGATSGDTRLAQVLDAASVLDILTEGLGGIGMSEVDIDRWSLDLTLRMSDGRAAMDLLAEEQAQAWRHDELPTVPIDLHGSVRGARARRDREAWLGSLRQGDICRVFVDAHWQTLRLNKIEDDEQLYVLQGRESSEPIRMTRGALALMRNEGLATTVEVGAFIARAMDSMNTNWRGPDEAGKP